MAVWAETYTYMYMVKYDGRVFSKTHRFWHDLVELDLSSPDQGKKFQNLSKNSVKTQLFTIRMTYAMNSFLSFLR